MAESVVSSVGQTIGKLLIDEAKFLWGVKGKVEDLQRELKLIRAFLRDADARREHDHAVGEWVAQLRDIAYDAEDVIERYILRVALKKGQNIIKVYACFVAKCMCFKVHVVGTEIEGLKSRISNLRTSVQDHGIQSVNEGERERARVSTPRRTFAHFEEDFVGREDSIEVLVEELLNDGKQHRVISILGMGGVGKTLLARKVFTHAEVKNNFTGFAWACVSQEYRVKDILVEILVMLIPDQRERVMKMIERELFEDLYKIQQEKRCIVVLDDIWTKQAWDSLRAAFPIKNTRSKLLITTRNRDVAEYIDPQGLFHELRCLSHLESWDLLKKKAFLETQEITGDMKRLGDELLKKCGGLPLAVIVLGGLLAVNEWETVHKKINLHFRDESDVSKVLALSYDDLPWHLKPCFLYLGSFPEDAEIHATKVLHMWIAEGFVLLNANDRERKIQVEVEAEQYLTELVKRGIVQVRFNSSGKIKTLHLHDLMRDLCVSKATHESFLSIINVQQDNETEDGSSLMAIKDESTRRLSVNWREIEPDRIQSLEPEQSLEQIGKAMLHLRTFMIFGFTGIGKKWEQFQPIFINCKFLRVLKLEHMFWMGKELPESVGDLVHLRFLSLQGSSFEILPQSMGNLVCMEFLNLHNFGMANRVIVPNVLWKMRRLRHLYLPPKFLVKEIFHGHRKKLRLDTIKNLRTLKNFSSIECDVNDVGKLTNQRKLTVGPLVEKLEIIPRLAKFNLKHLQSSYFSFKSNSFTEDELSKMSSCRYSCKLSLVGKIEKLPEHKNLPPQLRKLYLYGSLLEEDPMPILEKLQHLVLLALGETAFMGKEMVCSAGGFPQLNHLILYYLPNLEEWRAAEEAMPHLSRLGIWDCTKLKTVPRGDATYDTPEEIVREVSRLKPFVLWIHNVRRS